jgi:hypothetical protein
MDKNELKKFDSQLLTQEEAAAFLRVNPRSLERWRAIGDGPTFVKLGRKVLYRLRDLETWIESQTRTRTPNRRRVAGDHAGISTPLAVRFIEELELPVRAYYVLKDNGVLTIDALKGMSERDLLRLPGCGKLTVEGIRFALQRWNSVEQVLGRLTD